MEYLSFRELQTMEVKTNERGETVEGSKKLKSEEAPRWRGSCRRCSGSGSARRQGPGVALGGTLRVSVWVLSVASLIK